MLGGVEYGAVFRDPHPNLSVALSPLTPTTSKHQQPTERKRWPQDVTKNFILFSYALVKQNEVRDYLTCGTKALSHAVIFFNSDLHLSW